MRYLIDERVLLFGISELAQIFELTTRLRGEAYQYQASGTKVVVAKVVGGFAVEKKCGLRHLDFVAVMAALSILELKAATPDRPIK